jgi:ABC-2 type transport system ATP-binding protein
MVSGGTTVIVSTAYLDEAERCDRVALLHEGRLVVIDAPERLQSRLENRVWSIRSEEPRRVRDWLRDCSAVKSAVLFGDIVHVTVTDEPGAWDETRAGLEAAGFAPVEQTAVEPSLEDVFIDFVQ